VPSPTIGAWAPRRSPRWLKRRPHAAHDRAEPCRSSSSSSWRPALARPLLESALDAESLQSWATIFVAITVQALPFLVLGVIVSGAIAAFVPSELLGRMLPRRPALAVPVAAAAGVALPGCECGSVPIAGRLWRAASRRRRR
jgi:uncharacterized membrane protein YraQ (UPF0718 family)